MPKEPVSVHKIKTVLQLCLGQGRSRRMVATHCGIARSTVGEYVDFAFEAGLTAEKLEGLDDESVWALFRKRHAATRDETKRAPDVAQIHEDLRLKSTTLQALWEAYYGADPETGYKLTQYCELYRDYRKSLKHWLRQEHRAGERLFLDYSGMTLPIWDKTTGEVSFQAQIFVGCMGASNYTYAEATRSQKVAEWVGAHVRCFRFLGGVPEILTPDRLKSAVQGWEKYEPTLNRTYEEMADHYGCVIVPARPRKPKDKGKVENAVLVVQRWVLVHLRRQRFFDLESLNDALRALVAHLNDKPMRNGVGSRRELFERIDKPALRPLPEREYSYGKWIRAKVARNNHVAAERNFYSVPYQINGQHVDVRLGFMTTEVFFKGQRVAAHARAFGMNEWRTNADHRPKEHAAYAGWTPEEALRRAQAIGPKTLDFMARVLAGRFHYEQGYGASNGVFALGRDYGHERLEMACGLALSLGARDVKTLRALLHNGRDRVPPQTEQLKLPQTHVNLRDKKEYN